MRLLSVAVEIQAGAVESCPAFALSLAPACDSWRGAILRPLTRLLYISCRCGQLGQVVQWRGPLHVRGNSRLLSAS